MKKTTSRFWVDIFLFISMSGLFFTGIIMTFFTDSGPYANEVSKYFFRLHRHQWGNIHLYFAIVFLILLVIHLIFEWEWIKGKTRNIFKRIWILVPIASVAVVILFISWYVTPKYTDYYKKYGKEWQKLIEVKNKQRLMNFENKRDFEQRARPKEREKKIDERSDIGKESDAVVITGQHSLIDIERTCEISARNIAKLLGLPRNVSLTVKLGKLRKQYLFSIHEVREIVYTLMRERSDR